MSQVTRVLNAHPGAARPPEAMITYVVVTAGHGGLMARFADNGQLLGWTPHIKRASLFMTAQAGAAAIRGMCMKEFEEAVRKGRAAKFVDEETGEVMFLKGGPHGEPWTPRIPLADRDRNIYSDPSMAGAGLRRDVRGMFREARRNPTRQTEALIPVSTGTDYTKPASARARHAGAYAHM